MKYPSELYRKADDILSERRQRSDYDLQRRRESVQLEHPDVYAIYSAISRSGVALGAAPLVSNPDDMQLRISEHMALRVRLIGALEAEDLEPDYLDPRPHCSVCTDKGFVGGKSCECRNAILNRLAYEWLSNISRADECSFDNFSLDYYQGDNIKTMDKLHRSCKRYAEAFSRQSTSLLFIGPPGLGKTHLSLSIAGSVARQGRLALYASAPQLLERLVNISFTTGSKDEYKDIAYSCDLLVIDDLGSEFQTRFTQSEVYSLINTRLIESRPTIINTNLAIKELRAAYGDRVASRLIGEYKVNHFSGIDIRYQRRLNQ